MRCVRSIVSRHFTVKRAVLRACLAAITTLGVAGCGSQLNSNPPTVACHLRAVTTFSGAPASLGLDARGAAVPVWSAAIGEPSVVGGGTAYGTMGGQCVVATDVETGRVEWTAAPPSDHPELFGVSADEQVVLAATGVSVGQAPAAVFPLVDQLTAYDSSTGHALWDVVIANDGQAVPALLTGPVIVVSEADGSLVGLRERDGRQLWRDPPPHGCTGNSIDETQPDAAVIGATTTGGVRLAVIAYACPAGGGVAAIDPSNGVRRWMWAAPEGWDVDMQTAATVDTGTAGADVVAAPISLTPQANAPAHVAPAPAPSYPTRLPNPYDHSETTDVVVLELSTGRVLWDLTGVAGSLSTVGGEANLCVLNDLGADCRDAIDGTSRWSTTWPGANASATYPALSCVDEETAAQPCAASSDGRLDLALATDSAPAYPPGPGPPSPSGSFVITALDMSTGKTDATLALPSFDNSRSDHGVSLALPPAVLMVADGMVLVSPQFRETDVVEAFQDPGSA